MKKYISTTKISIALSALLTLGACEQNLEVKPRLAVALGAAYNSPEALNAALNGVYDVLQGSDIYGRDLIAVPEALADNGRATNKSGRLLPEQQNQPGSHLVNWGSSYVAINRANLILKALPGSSAPQATKDAIEGQCLFLRGLLYFDLMKAYAYFPRAVVASQNVGGVPLLLEGVDDLPKVTLPSRASIDECYAQIAKDLDGAITKLTNNNSTYRAPFFATKGAAQALAARVALYTGRWADALKFANDAIASGVGRFQTNAQYLAAWRAASHPESMFELSYQTNENIGVNVSLQTSFTTLRDPGNRATTAGFGDLVPTATLLTDLGVTRTGDVVTRGNDVRALLYELGTTGRGPAEVECTKFIGRSATVNLDNVPVIRISEMYLIRAEANYELGNAAAALTDLNAIRTRAGLTAATATELSGTALLNEIMRQRRIEFAFEGHRFFDLKRRGLDIVKSPRTIAFTDFVLLARIPTGEISLNPNLKQNFGY